MIRNFQHKGLEAFFRHGSKAGIRFVGADAELVDYQDYH